MYTVKDFYEEIRSEIPSIKCKNLKNIEICLPNEQLEMIKKLLLMWSNNSMVNEAEKLLNDILRQPNNQNGKVYEALVYSWLSNHSIRYKPQFHINKEYCFKKENEGFDSDGIIIEESIVFDIKKFGLTLPHIETLRKKIQEKISSEYYIIISGSENISTREIKVDFLEKIDELVVKIMKEENKNHTDYIYHDLKHRLEFRVCEKKPNRLFISMSEFDLYEWAANNEFYFMYHASQFCFNVPYILFCPFDRNIAYMFSNNDINFIYTTFRALCRRIFINLLKMESRKINEFDGKAISDISISTASRKISAIVFMDVSEEYNDNNCRIFVYQNPNADHKLKRYQVNTMFRNAGAYIEDFLFDNY